MENKHRIKERILRLAKPVRKGVFHIIFSRFPLVLLLLALQIVPIGILLVLLDEYLPYFAVVRTVFVVLVTIYLFNSAEDSSAKLTWMLLISIFPTAGAILLFFVRTNFGRRRMREEISREVRATMRAIPQPEEVLASLKNDPSGTDDLSAYLCRTGCFPVFEHTETRFFGSGEEAFPVMLEELEKAENYIFLEFFIIEEGYMWGRILDILTRKAAAGVDVRVIYDGMCELSQLPWGYAKLLTAAGVPAKVHSPLRPVLSTRHNYRDHRKILVIDGRSAFTGGINLADEYINRVTRFGYWKDTALMLKGDAVRSFTLMFLQMWNVGSDAPLYEPFLGQAAAEPAVPSDGFVMPFADSPLDGENAAKNVFIDILSRATDYVHIMTPYLILDDELQNTLTFTAKRGVDVTLILPGIPDKKLPYALAKNHYRALTEAGVRIFEYTPGFVHAKVCVSDGCKAVVGTINFDYRSLCHHFECAAYLYKCSCIAAIEADFQKTLAGCAEVTPSVIKNEKLAYRLAGRVLKALAPLL